MQSSACFFLDYRPSTRDVIGGFQMCSERTACLINYSPRRSTLFFMELKAKFSLVSMTPPSPPHSHHSLLFYSVRYLFLHPSCCEVIRVGMFDPTPLEFAFESI